MAQVVKLWVLSFATGALAVLAVHGATMWVSGDSQVLPSDSTRMMSLGSPKVINLDKAKGEQKIIMNDPSIQKNWGLMGTNGASDIKVNNAWSITQGDRNVVVAIIDTGIDVKHSDLHANIWQNPGESGLDKNGKSKSTNSIDDDNNGYIDDINGWDFVNNKPFVIDNHGHGTHIAGIVGAVGGNGIGMSGVCPKVSLMALKYYDPTSKGNDNLRNTVRAIRYAAKMGAHIINYSGGGTEPNDDEFEAIKYSNDKGVLFVAAAGNERSNSDLAPYYPADYNLPNIISVTAIDSFAKVLKTSNYGIKSVHLAAPGEGIYSTLPNGNYGLMTGTSQATAFVSGVAALILAHNRDFNAAQVKKQIIATADELPELRDKTSTSGKLNSYAALAMLPAIPATGIATAVASAPITVTVEGQRNEKVTLNALLQAISTPNQITGKRNAAQAL
ncbi:MAG: S8 family peptidase [Oligoflexia bacterium]|nr:S8 family peptidase [Oligoflexia bacterium]